MKKLNILFFAFLAFLLVQVISCSEGSTTSGVITIKEGETLIGNLNPNGVHSLTIDKESIMGEFGGNFNLTKIDYVKSYTNKNGIPVLEFAGPHKDGLHYVTIGKALSSVKGKLIMARATCTQSCTSVYPCTGCDLFVTGDCSGSCSCNAGGGYCTHTVTQGGGN